MMRRWLLGLAIATVGAPGGPSAALARPEPCPAARYVIQAGTLLPDAPASQVDVVFVGGTPPTAALSIGCTEPDLRRAVRVRAVRRGTKVAAQWRECAGHARVRLKGIITDGCTRLAASLRADGIRTQPTGMRSSCGDGFVDVALGEECEPGGSACDGGACGADCRCAGATTSSTITTTSSTSTTTLACNPLAAPGAQGCAADEKCTWITVDEELGVVGCAPSGTVALGGSCTQGPAGEMTGYDDCAAGLVCIAEVCRDVCGFDGSPEAACAAGDDCTKYAGLFENGDEEPVAGACNEGCDPLTQLTTSGDPCPAGEGCYLLSDAMQTIAVCADAGTLTHGAGISGPAWANSCLPRHMPRLRIQGMTTMECGALCDPVDVYQGVNESSEEGVAPYNCTAFGAAPPSDAEDGESCHYWWMREASPDVTPFSNSVGWCFRHAAFLYDSNDNGTPDAPYPRCITLTTGDVVPPLDGGSDALFFGCVALPPSLPAPLPSEPPASRPPRLLLDRVGGWR